MMWFIARVFPNYKKCSKPRDGPLDNPYFNVDLNKVISLEFVIYLDYVHSKFIENVLLSLRICMN